MSNRRYWNWWTEMMFDIAGQSRHHLLFNTPEKECCGREHVSGSMNSLWFPTEISDMAEEHFPDGDSTFCCDVRTTIVSQYTWVLFFPSTSSQLKIKVCNQEEFWVLGSTNKYTDVIAPQIDTQDNLTSINGRPRRLMWLKSGGLSTKTTS